MQSVCSSTEELENANAVGEVILSTTIEEREHLESRYLQFSFHMFAYNVCLIKSGYLQINRL